MLNPQNHKEAFLPIYMYIVIQIEQTTFVSVDGCNVLQDIFQKLFHCVCLYDNKNYTNRHQTEADI